MHDGRFQRAGIIAAALALAGCGAGETPERPITPEGGAAFAERLETARIAMREGDLVQAGRLYDEAFALEPSNPALWVDIARLRYRGGEHFGAIETAERALALDGTFAPALLLRGQMVRDAHGPADALAWFEAALEIDPGNPDIHAEYAATLGELGRYTDMLHAVRTLARVAPDHPQVHYLQAVLAARAQDPVLARTLLSQSGLAEAGVPAAMLLDALIHMQQGTHDTAADILETLAARQPANNRIAELLAKAWWMGGRDRAVVERFEEVARDDAASPYLAMLVGRSLERLGERDRAIPFIERARRRAGVGPISLPSSEDMPAMTRDLRYRLALGDGAAGAAILGEFPQSADAHMLAGDAAFIEGDTLRAIDLYQTAAQVRRPWALTRKLVAAYRAAGADRAADALLLRHAAAEPQNGDALIMLARRSLLAEDWLRADLLLSRAAQLGIGTDPAILDLRAQAARGLGYDEAARQFDQARMHLAPRLLAPL